MYVRFYWRDRKFFPRGGNREKISSELPDSAIDWNNIDDLIGVALVYFGLSEKEFIRFTPIEFNKLLEIKGDEKLKIYKQDMEIMRMQTFMLINIQLEKKKQLKSLHSFMPFDWDVVIKPKIISEDQFKKYDRDFPSSSKKIK